jgi:hypothetical protein
MAGAGLNLTERGYLLDAIEQLGSLGTTAPELPGHSQAAFRSCHSLLRRLAGVGDAEDEAQEDFWDRPGGSGELNQAEVAVMQGLLVALRRVVNGCEGATPSFRRAVAASGRLAMALIPERAERPGLKAVTV